MLKDLEAALAQDLKYELPANYMAGAGDTYFSGKMLAKLARIALISDQMGAAFIQDRASAVRASTTQKCADEAGALAHP